jgi:hypothetical protein
LETSLIKAAPDFKSTLAELENILHRKAMEWARNMYREILSCLDEQIKERRGRDFAIVRLDETWHTTMLGSIRIKRRYYRCQDGSYHYLLDELMGMAKHCHVSCHVKKLALELASQMPFRRSAWLMARTTPVNLSHQSIHRIVADIANRNLASRDKASEWFQSTGELGWGQGRNVTRLLVEADGVMLPLQREGKRKAEARLAVSYEGHRKIGRDRYRTVNKLMHADITGANPFWSAVTLKLNQTYDLSGIGHTVLGGDGAGWVRQGAGYFGASYQLCRFHLNRNLARTLGYDSQSLKVVKEAVGKGDVPVAINLLDSMAAAARGDKRRDIARLAGYIKANLKGITSYPGPDSESRGTGAIEGNIDKLIVRRMKNQGMSWSIRGARCMLWLRVAMYEGVLDECLTSNPGPRPYKLPEKTVRKVIDKKINQDYTDYFAAGLPALTGPHASRPWAKVLKSIAGGA